MAKFTFGETTPADEVFVAKLGNNTIANGGGLTDADRGKFVKLVAPDTYDLCADGDEIEGILLSLEPASVDGYSFGSILFECRKKVTLQGAIANGAYVLCASPVARGTALTGPAKVKAGVAASQLAAAPYTYTPATPSKFLWRTISGAGTDASVGVIEFIY